MNLSFNRNADPENMHADIVSWPDQLRVGWQQGRDAAKDHKDAPVPKKVLWAGMGGSAIGGDFFATLLADRAPFPLIVHRGGPLPQWVDEKTLVVLASYSGNTAETLAASREAISRNSLLVALTTGGRLGQFADQDRIERWPVQPGRMPRAALAEMLGAAMGAFHEHGWLSIDPVAFEECLRNIEELTESLSQTPDSKHTLSGLLQDISERHPMVYGSGILVPVARRWAAQLNENAKRAAQWGAMPEMNHNEVVPWVDGGSWTDRYTVVLLDDPGALDDVRKRIPVTRDLAEAAGWKPHVLVPEGDHELTRMLSLAVMGDWLSYWIALAEDTDPTPIPTIDKLKKRLEE